MISSNKSGGGKTTVTLGLMKALKNRGYKVTIQKFDPYINVDPGTMSPFQHGEVFVTDDGAETDLDLDKQYSIVQIKLALKKLGYCFLGYKNCNGMFLNQDNNQIVQFNSNDRLLVLTKGV